MTTGQRSGTGRAAWVVVVLAIVAALAWWWSSGRGAATLSELGVLPPQWVAGSDTALPTPAVLSAAASDQASHEAPTPDSTTDDDPLSVAGAVAPADSLSATESESESESGTEEAVAISGLPPTAEGSQTQVPAIAYPLPALPADTVLAPSGVAPALDDLLKPKAAAAFLQSADFAHRFVATVDNLGRSFAPPSHWPINPAPDRFTFEEQGGRTYIAPDSYKRYGPLVQLATVVDTGTAIDIYARMYPQLQAAYAELGFPKTYFNDRLIQIIDLLLASPEPSGPIEVEHTKVPNAPPPIRPWVNFQFADPALDALTAGQKIMIRVGPDNQRKLKAKLADLRAELLTRVLPRE